MTPVGQIPWKGKEFQQQLFVALEQSVVPVDSQNYTECVLLPILGMAKVNSCYILGTEP